MNFFEFFICILLVAISGFMSASEIALFSLSRFQIRGLKERSRSSHSQIKRLLSDPAGLLIIILVINEIVNISLSTLITQAIAQSDLSHFLNSTPLFEKTPTWALHTGLGILFVSPVVLLFCEITPKVIAARANQVIAPLTVGPLSLVYDFLKPLRIVLKKFVAVVSRLINRKPNSPDEAISEEKPLLKEEDFLNLVEEGHKEGAIRQNEVELIRNVFDLDDICAQDVHTPFNRVYSLPPETTLEDALLAMRTVQYSRIPVVYKKSGRSQVSGILYSKDLLVAKLEKLDPSTPISSLMEKPLFTQPTSRLNALFRKMKNQKMHIAVVEQPIGNPVGIVTMTDILDALFEEII